jgi:hypothetical protein
MPVFPPCCVLVPIREQLDNPIDSMAECYLWEGRPHQVLADWDLAEDWSGEYVREVPPADPLRGEKISAEQFWALVRSMQSTLQGESINAS